jgi:hypothetical protein
MRDAVDLLEKFISVNEINYVIKGFYYIPDSNKVYVKLQKADFVYVNMELVSLLPFINQSIKL